MKVVTYSTSPFYDRHAENLQDSLEALRLDFAFERVDDLGSPKKNMQQKPSFLLRMLDKFPASNLLWLDADCVVLSPPSLLLADPDCDFAACFWRDWFCYSSAMFLAPSAPTRNLLALWMTENSRRPELLDDQNLTAVLLRKPEVQVLKLPHSYRWIAGETEPGVSREEAIVEHFAVTTGQRGLGAGPVH